MNQRPEGGLYHEPEEEKIGCDRKKHTEAGKIEGVWDQHFTQPPDNSHSYWKIY